MNEADMTKVVVYTKNFVVEGEIALLPGARLTDFIRSAEDFFAVVNATVKNHKGELKFETNFLDLSVDKIELITPAAEVK